MEVYNEPVPESVRTLDAILHRCVATAPTNAELLFWLDLASRAKRRVTSASPCEVEAVAVDVIEHLAWAA